MLLKLSVRNFAHCGANISFLSCFPGEVEYLYPPGTYLHPIAVSDEVIAPSLRRQASREVLQGGGQAGPTAFKIVEVEPDLP